jgi:hypothetical protein
MASHQMPNQRRSSGNQQSQTAKRPTASRSDEEAGDYGSLRGVANQASRYWERGEDQMRDMIRDREGAVIAMALAAGVGVGLVLGVALGSAHHEPRTWRDRMMAEGFGRRLMDRIESMIPDALAEHFAK